MWASVVNDPGEGVSCPVSDASMPLLQKYTCLGLPMTACLNLILIVQNRKRKTTKAYHAMRTFLIRRHIPVVIRVQIVRSMRILIATSRCKLQGMPSIRLSPFFQIQIISTKTLTKTREASYINQISTDTG